MSKGVILFADDDPRFLKARKEFLEEEGYQVIPATDPTEARKILEKGEVELAILDIRLINDTDGRDISGLTLAKGTAPSVPKIILTGFPTWEAVRDALGSDLDGSPLTVDFISKQEGPEAMLRAVARAIKPLPTRRWRSLAALLMLSGAVTFGIVAMVSGDPRWLFGTVALGILYAILTWILAVE